MVSLVSILFVFNSCFFFGIKVDIHSGKTIPKFFKEDGDLDTVWRLGGVEMDVGFGCHGYGLGIPS